MKPLRHAVTLSAAWIAVALTIQPGYAQSKDAEPATRAVNDAFAKSLPFADRADFEDAKRGFIATLPDGVVAGAGSKPAFDTRPYAFLQKEEAPATVNPRRRNSRRQAVVALPQRGDRTLRRAALDAITLKQRTFLGSIATGDVSISGNPLKLRELFGLLDDFTPDFEIVEPRKVSVE
jgi:alkyl sulfatase BDS1-like metallo-beta-lactamase superfamily hydrolase